MAHLLQLRLELRPAPVYSECSLHCRTVSARLLTNLEAEAVFGGDEKRTALLAPVVSSPRKLFVLETKRLPDERRLPYHNYMQN